MHANDVEAPRVNVQYSSSIGNGHADSLGARSCGW